MEPHSWRRHEVVFETDPGPPDRLASAAGAPHPDAVRCAQAATALRRLGGVTEVHVDHHGTWAMVTFDPELTAVETLTDCLAAYGLAARRNRFLPAETDAGPITEGPGVRDP